MIWSLVHLLLNAFLFALLAHIVLSWFPPSGPGALDTIRLVLQRITEPVLGPIRRLIPGVRLGGIGLDLSPLIVFLVIEVLLQVLPN
ncbi:MAG: YggT family protein [Acidobacteria bacterium]|nr:YggT family protein [Acidobacteriota bacterium]